jgi:hypothetical protein
LSQDADGYTRYSSPPVGFDQQQQQQQQQHGHPGVGGHPQQHASSSAYAPAGAGGQMHSRTGYGAQGPNAPVGYGANFAWPGVNDATTQMGVQFGRSAISAGQSYVQQNVSREPFQGGGERYVLTIRLCDTSRFLWSRHASK